MRWFSHVERKGEGDWVMACQTLPVNGNLVRVVQVGVRKVCWNFGRHEGAYVRCELCTGQGQMEKKDIGETV